MQQAMTGREKLLQKISSLHRLSDDDMAKRRAESIKMATPPDGIQCVRCGNTGWIEETRSDGYDTVAPCPACYQRRMIARRLKQSGVSAEDYARFTLANFEGHRSNVSMAMKKLAVEYLQHHTPNGPGFGLFGSSGMGKTHLCIAVCQELTRRFDEPHFYFSYRSQMPELIKSMKDFKSKYDEDMMHWKTCPNLYIDDLFKLSGTVENGHLTSIDRDDLRIMFDIINARNLNHLTTLFSSEYSVKDITAIDAALGSRIFQMVTPYALGISGANQRLEGA